MRLPDYILFLFVLLVHSLPAQFDWRGQNHSFELRNLINEKKTVPLNNRKLLLQVDESKTGTEHLSRLNNVEGRFDTIAGDSLVVTLFSEETDIEYRNRYTNISTSYYPLSSDRVTRSFAIKDILYINTKNPLRQKLVEAGSVIMALSIVAIVTSPLAGQSLQGDERATRRSQVFMSGVGGFMFSIPFFVLGKNKKYGMSPLFRTRRTNYWTLRQIQ